MLALNDCREKLRQLELPSALASKSNPAFSTPSSRPQLAAAPTSQAITAAAGPAVPAAGAVEVQLQLNQDLVAATVKLDSANRRLEVLEREKDRLNKSLEEAQVSRRVAASGCAASGNIRLAWPLVGAATGGGSSHLL